MHALRSNTTGLFNTALGFNAGAGITTGSSNIAIGYDAQVASATGSNQVRIGDTAITYAGIQVAWTVTSDRRWKDDIQSVGLGLDFIRALRPVDYFRKNDTSQKREAGFIAQEVESTLAQFGYQDSGMLNKDDNGYYSLRYNDFFAPIVRAIQELASSVKNNTTEINTLKSENESLKKRLDAIEARLGK